MSKERDASNLNSTTDLEYLDLGNFDSMVNLRKPRPTCVLRSKSETNLQKSQITFEISFESKQKKLLRQELKKIQQEEKF